MATATNRNSPMAVTRPKSCHRVISNQTLEAWYQYVYERVNPAGEHVEYWHHSFGCNKWFKLTRNTINNEISGSSKP